MATLKRSRFGETRLTSKPLASGEPSAGWSGGELGHRYHITIRSREGEEDSVSIHHTLEMNEAEARRLTETLLTLLAIYRPESAADVIELAQREAKRVHKQWETYPSQRPITP
jgi:hypothetical protein